jgi:hypothetical protein
MTGLSDLPDPKKSRAMFEEAYGATRGRRWFRVALQIVIPLVAILGILLLVVWGGRLTKELRDWFSPATAGDKPLQPLGTQNCVITGGENRGTQIQNCN